MKKALCSIVAAMPFLVSAASWEVVSSDYNNEMYFTMFEIDISSVIKRDGLVRVWSRTSVRPDRDMAGSFPAKTYGSYLSLDHFDCEAKEATSSQILYYSKAFGEGENVYSVTNPKDSIKKSLEAIPPGTFLESMMKRACSIANRQKK